MPHELADFASLDRERQVTRAAEEGRQRLAREQQERRVAGFYQQVRRDDNFFVSALRLDSSQPIKHKALSLPEAVLPVLDEKQMTAGQRRYKKQLEQLTASIAMRDVRAVGSLLGLPIYQARQDLLKKFNANQLKWAQARAEFELLQLKGWLMREYVSQRQFPVQFDAGQEEDFKKFFSERFGKIKDSLFGKEATDILWHLNLKAVLIDQLRPQIEQTIRQLPTSSLRNIREKLYETYQRSQILQGICQTCVTEQDKLNKTSQLLISISHPNAFRTLLDRWVLFQQRMSRNYSLVPGSLFLAVGVHGFTDAGLSDPLFLDAETPVYLLENALDSYAKAGNEAERRQSLAIIEALVSQGAKPSLAMIEILLVPDSQSSIDFQKKLTWPVLALLLKHQSTKTPFSEIVRQKLIAYIAGLEQGSWYRRMLMTEHIKNQRLADVQIFAMVLCYPNWHGGELDHHLASEIQKRKKLAGHVDSSSLYRALSAAMTDMASGELVAAMEKGPVEMKSLAPDSPAYKNLRFMRDSNAELRAVTDEVPTDPRVHPEPARSAR